MTGSSAAGPPPLVLVTGDFVRTGGMDRANHALASYLAREDAQREVHLVAHRAADDLLRHPNVRFHCVPKPLGSYLLGSPLLAGAGRRVARALAERGARVIVNGGNCAWPDLNWVHYVHSAWAPRIAPDTGPLRRLKSVLTRRRDLSNEASALRRARVIIANSQRTARDLSAGVPGIDPARVHVVYYGTDPSEFHPATGAQRKATRASLSIEPEVPLLAFVGALGDRRKGFDLLFDAWRALQASDVSPAWDARLLVIGAGAELDRWRERAADDPRLAESIRFVGFRTDVPVLLAACDGIVSPTRYEAFGLGVQEALCCGVPAIVSRDAGVVERIPPALHELLFDPASPMELVARLRAWRGGLNRYRTSAVEASAELSRYGWDDMARAIVNLLQSA